MANNTFFLLLSFALGILLRYATKKGNLLKKIINNYIIYIGYPIFLFVLMIEAKDFGKMLYVTFIALAVFHFAAFIIIKFLNLPKKTKSALFICTTFGNIGFIGVPMIYLFLGIQAASVAAIVIIVYNLVTFTLGLYLSNAYIKNNWSAFFDFIKFPGIYTLLIAFILSRFGLVAPKIVVDISHATVYIATLVVGLAFDVSYFKDVHAKLAFFYGFIIKFLVAAIVLVGISFAFNMDKMFVLVMLILATTPAAVGSTSIAVHYKFDEAFTATFTSITTLVYLIATFLISIII
ncbi:MAG: AEC family transporter [archaeon]